MSEKLCFPAPQIEALARALGDTEYGLIGYEITALFGAAKMVDPGEGTKWKRIHSAFAEVQNRRQDRTNILEFIRQALNPARYASAPHRFEPLRTNVNRALAFAGLAVNDAGKLIDADAVSTLPEAERRARELRSDLELRRVHPDVLAFCKSELLQDDYFHAVLEAVKSIAAKLRDQTGLHDDGALLIDHTLCGAPPLRAINLLQTDSQRKEQSGFANLVKGIFGMFRNPTAHEPRLYWIMTKDDAEDILTMVSMVHRRLDGSHMPPRS